MQTANAPLSSRSSLSCLMLVALCHVFVFYILQGKGLLHSTPAQTGQVIYMEMRSVAAASPPAGPAASLETPHFTMERRKILPKLRAKNSNRPSALPEAGMKMPAPPEALSTAIATPAGTPPALPATRLDLEGLRKLARDNDRSRQKTSIEQLRESQLASSSIEARVGAAALNAQRGDCRTAHANLGLLAPLLILKDALTDKGCKW
ncbi:hypothetical protein ACO0LO_08750 [Undibacterium sp. TJN25]|uniref:hypothetical protein n=1 Tax=Undibacterium sp. TJN25 TaxID=3413056 RepID=UPI003BF0F5D7